MYHGRKFDIRIWALVTDDFRIYLYREGYVRTSSSDYNLRNKNNFVHLTNQCLQIKGDGYAQHEEGNTLSFHDLQRYMDEHHKELGITIEDHLMPRMRDITIDTFLSVRHKMNPNKRKDVFELFGFDFLLDEDFRIWLIECNTNPYLGTPCKYMESMLPQMMTDMFKIVLDPTYGPRNVPDADRPNGFHLLDRE